MLLFFLIVICIGLIAATVFLGFKYFEIRSERDSSVEESEGWEKKSKANFQAGVKLKAICVGLLKYKPISDIDQAVELRKKKKIELEGEILEAKKSAELIISAAQNDSFTLLDEARGKASGVIEEANTRALKIVSDGKVKAREIAGDAYLALENKVEIEKAIRAMNNIIKGYGDEYLVPTASVLDDIAEEWGHKEAGEELKAARKRSKTLVVNKMAAECDYSEAKRKSTAIQFVIDAFNGRVDAILSDIRHDNVGTLNQKIRDVFSVVNKNGEAFRNARIRGSYLSARLNELKWAAAVQELRRLDREEQKRIREAIREEERVRKEIEKVLREAKREEEMLQKAMAEARKHLAEASESQRHEYENKLVELERQLHEANEKNQRAVSMAQQTRQGHVYVISNIGSFGENVFKIGMTRRLEPLDRVKELGDASVPFPFDVHAIIHSTDAPSLESELQTHFSKQQVNLVNSRKEFYRVGLNDIRGLLDSKEIEASWTMRAEAMEYRESLAIQKKNTGK